MNMDVLVTFNDGTEEGFYGIKEIKTIPDKAGGKVRLYDEEDTTYTEYKTADIQNLFCEIN